MVKNIDLWVFTDLLDAAWHRLRSNWMLRQLDVSYNRFHRHPLYRRWSVKAYDHPAAHHAEVVPEKVTEALTVLTLGGPLALLVIQLLFGGEAFKVLAYVVGVTILSLALLLPVAGLMFSALLAALPLAQERASGRWELLMLLPRERANVLVMRISSILYPYRPVLVTLDVLQTLVTFLSIMVVSAWTRGADDLISTCFVFFIPAMLLLSWERRQDHVLSLAVGAFAGLVYHERLVLSRTIMMMGLVLGLRLMMVLLAFGVSGYALHLSSAVPGLVGGVGMLSISGVSFFPALGFALLYYALREALITAIWRNVVHHLENM